MTRYIKKPKTDNFAIVCDDREKKPWTFPKDQKVVRKRLKCGDYSIKGFEDLIAIEKKSGIQELFTDLTGKYRARFRRFLNRLSKYPIKCIIVEQTLDDCGVYNVLRRLQFKSRGKTQLSENTIPFWTSEISLSYEIPVIFASLLMVDRLIPIIFRAAYKKAQEHKTNA